MVEKASGRRKLGLYNVSDFSCRCVKVYIYFLVLMTICILNTQFLQIPVPTSLYFYSCWTNELLHLLFSDITQTFFPFFYVWWGGGCPYLVFLKGFWQVGRTIWDARDQIVVCFVQGKQTPSLLHYGSGLHSPILNCSLWPAYSFVIIVLNSKVIGGDSTELIWDITMLFRVLH